LRASPTEGKTVAVPLPAPGVADVAHTSQQANQVAATSVATTSSRITSAELGSVKKSNPEGVPAADSQHQAGDAARNVPPQTVAPVDSRKSVQAAEPAPTIAAPAVQPATIGAVGTGSAKQVTTMKSQGKVEGTARSGEKNLPRGSFLPENGKGEATVSLPRTVSTPASNVTQANASPNSPLSALASVSLEKAIPVAAGAHVENARPPQADKVFTDVTECAVSFKRVGMDSADVNLRPDQSTEINLRLSVNNGQVEVAARLERGNFDSLNTHWADLQQSLAQQGIRIGQLDHASFNQNFGGNQQNNQTTSSQTAQQGLGDGPGRHPSARTTEGPEESPLSVASAVLTRGGRNNGSAAATGRGWEMWA
jgi:hypothetical protein